MKKSLAYIVLIGLLIYVRFAVLQADIPLDVGGYGMAYTDEGWWSRNAIAWVREGDWYIDDGYNTITNLPVLPVIQVVWFKLFGAGLASARAITVICSLLVSVEVYWFARREASANFAWIAPFIVLTNYPTFAYSRLALLEMPMLVFLLASLWLASNPQKRSPAGTVTSGLFFALAVMTKTTALFAFPVVAIALLEQGFLVSSVRKGTLYKGEIQHRSIFPKVRSLFIWLLTVGSSVGLCYLILNQAGDAQSQTYFSDYNVAGKVPKTLFAFLEAPVRVIKRSLSLFPLLFPGLLSAIFLLFKAGKIKSSPLLRMIILWTGAALCAFSLSDYAAPRYFLVLIVPIALVMPLWLESLLTSEQLNGSVRPSLFPRSVSSVSALMVLVFILSTGISLFRTGNYLRQPQFSLVETAAAIDQHIAAEGSPSDAVVLGSFADSLALASDNIKAVNDRLGFRSLSYRIKTFDPDYYVSIGPAGSLEEQYVEIKATLEENYRLVLVNKFNLYQKRDYGEPIFFYRLEPLDDATDLSMVKLAL